MPATTAEVLAPLPGVHFSFSVFGSDGADIDSSKSEPIAGAVERQGYTRQRRACEDSCEVHISQGLPAGRCDPAFDIGAESRLGD